MNAKVGIDFAGHSRAQKMGPKAMEMLKLIPKVTPTITERCSGHVGKWGIFKKNFDKAIKVGRPAARGRERRSRLYGQRMPAGRTASQAGHGERRQATRARADRASDRIASQGLWILGKTY